MNRIVILCSVPAAEAFVRPGDTTTMIGVGLAAVVKPCDVWVCLELEGVRSIAPEVQGKPRLLTLADTAQLKPGQWTGDCLKDPDFWTLYACGRIEWKRFGGTTAVAYAAHLSATHAHLSATHIDVFGLDVPEQVECLDILAAHLKRTAGVHVTRHA